MTQRTDQVASTLQRATQDILSRGLADPRVQGIVTVTRVDVSADLANATLFCTIIPRKHEEISMHGLNAASRWIRRQVADKVKFRRMPKFSFKTDQQLLRQQEVLASIAEAKQEDEKKSQKKDEG